MHCLNIICKCPAPSSLALGKTGDVLIWDLGSNARFKNNLVGNIELSRKLDFVQRGHLFVLVCLTCFEAYAVAGSDIYQNKILCEISCHSAWFL